MNTRAQKARLVAEIQQASSKSIVDAFTDLLTLELQDAQEELEQAADNITIWRAQGRAASARNVIAAIKPRTAT